MGYPCLSLHEGKDQGDQESNINDFKTDVCSLLVATDEAASGLDGMQLDLSAMTLPTIMRSISKDWEALVGHHTVCLRSWVHTEKVHHMNPVIVNV